MLRTACSNQLDADRMRSVLREPISWTALFDLAAQHGVQPLLFQTLTRFAELVPADEMLTLKHIFETNVHNALLLSCELIGILDRLSAIGVEVMPYKGLALAQSVYGDIALRQSGDIDLLIHRRDLDRIRGAVRELGYTPHSPVPQGLEKAYLRSGYECAFDCAAGRNLLEVQWATQPRFYAIDLDVEELFRRAVIVSVAGRPVKTPSNEDLFIVLSVHAAKHVWERLIWLCDLARLMQLPSLDWEWIASRAKNLRIVRILRVGMAMANRVLFATVPPEAEARLPQDRDATELAGKFEAMMANSSPFNTESSEYFRWMLRLREHKWDRLRFLSRLAFTPGLGEWEAVRLPQPLFPVYRLVRLSRLAAKLVRSG